MICTDAARTQRRRDVSHVLYVPFLRRLRARDVCSELALVWPAPACKHHCTLCARFYVRADNGWRGVARAAVAVASAAPRGFPLKRLSWCLFVCACDDASVLVRTTLRPACASWREEGESHRIASCSHVTTCIAVVPSPLRSPAPPCLLLACTRIFCARKCASP